MKYFKHNTGLRFEPESRRMIKKFGLKGYGLYCACLELASESLQVNDVEPVLAETPEDIADYFNEKPETIYQMFEYAISENVVELSGRKYICHKVHTLLDEYLSKSRTMREAMEEYLNGAIKETTEGDEVLDYLNSLMKGSGRRGYTAGKETMTLINARLKDGFTVEDCKAVCLYKFNDWNGTSMEKYIRPKTLFRRSNFEGYLNEAVKPEVSEEEMRAAIRLEA